MYMYKYGIFAWSCVFNTDLMLSSQSPPWNYFNVHILYKRQSENGVLEIIYNASLDFIVCPSVVSLLVSFTASSHVLFKENWTVFFFGSNPQAIDVMFL